MKRPSPIMALAEALDLPPLIVQTRVVEAGLRVSWVGAPGVPRGTVVEEWAHLSELGFSRDEAASRLGMTRAAFDKALSRARNEES